MGNATLRPGQRYDMPPGFGPSVAPDLEAGFDLHGSNVEFETTVDAAEALMPRWFRATPRPTVSIGYRHMIGMSWMGGRNYRLIAIRVSAVCEFDGTERPAPFSLVIWESDYAPVVAGREFMGAPKLVAEIPEVPAVDADHVIECSEYGSQLLRASVTGLREVPADIVQRADRAQREAAVTSAYWKYIAGPGGTVDADYPVGIRMDTPLVAMWKGTGEINFATPTRTQAPYSSAIVARLAELPRLSPVTASAFKAARCKLFRGQTRRLDLPAKGTGS